MAGLGSGTAACPFAGAVLGTTGDAKRSLGWVTNGRAINCWTRLEGKPGCPSLGSTPTGTGTASSCVILPVWLQRGWRARGFGKGPRGRRRLLGPAAQLAHCPLPPNRRLSPRWPAVLPTFPLGRSPPRLTSAHPTLGSKDALPTRRPLAQLVVVTRPPDVYHWAQLRFLSSSSADLKGAPRDPSCWAVGGPSPLDASPVWRGRDSEGQPAEDSLSGQLPGPWWLDHPDFPVEGTPNWPPLPPGRRRRGALLRQCHAEALPAGSPPHPVNTRRHPTAQKHPRPRARMKKIFLKELRLFSISEILRLCMRPGRLPKRPAKVKGSCPASCVVSSKPSWPGPRLQRRTVRSSGR